MGEREKGVLPPLGVRGPWPENMEAVWQMNNKEQSLPAGTSCGRTTENPQEGRKGCGTDSA